MAAVDQRGHGQSDKPDTGYEFPTLCRDLVRVLDALGFERPVAAGQSFGGNVVLDLASRAPDRVGAIVGVDGGTIELRRRWPRWEDCAEILAPPPLAGAPRPDVEAMIRSFHPEWSDEGVQWTMANFETRPDGTVRPWLSRERHMRILRALWEHRPSEILARLRLPVLLVMADSGDEWTSAKREEAARDYFDEHGRWPDE